MSLLLITEPSHGGITDIKYMTSLESSRQLSPKKWYDYAPCRIPTWDLQNKLYSFTFTNTGIFEEDLYLNISKKDETFKYLGRPHTLKSNLRTFYIVSPVSFKNCYFLNGFHIKKFELCIFLPPSLE